MSERRRTEARLKTFGDIREIMSALRNTAVIETTRLQRLAPAQHDSLAAVERAAADFLCFHAAIDFDAAAPPMSVIIGSERGFCGDYNYALVDPLARALSESGARVIVVGRRLAALVQRRFGLDAVLPGASVADDIPAVVADLIAVLSARQMQGAPLLPLALHVLHHATENHVTRIEKRQPFAALARTYPPLRTPLRIQLSPDELLVALLEQYLYAALHAACHTALLAENTRRVQHLDGAMRRIDARRADLVRRRDTLRQEEITEEIELILLSADIPRGVESAPQGQF